MMRTKAIFVVLLLLIAVKLTGQEIPIGAWRSHFNYSDTRLLAIDQDKVYAASTYGFYYFDPEDNSLNKLSKTDGFGDVGIRAMKSIPESGGLIIGYESGMIDIFDANNTIHSIDIIKTSGIHPKKAIRSITYHNGLAYLSTDFGLIALDYKNRLVKESYNNIGAGGARIATYDGTVYNDSIFLASEEGVIGTSLDPTNNLLDFNNWKRMSPVEGLPQQPVKNLVTFNQALYCAIDKQGIYWYKAGQWERIDSINAIFEKIKVVGAELYIFSSEGPIKINTENQVVNDGASIPEHATDVIQDKNGDLWFASHTSGLLSKRSATLESMYPKGPFADHLNKVNAAGPNVVAIQASLDPETADSLKTGAFGVFSEGTWTNFTPAEYDVLSDFKGFSDVGYSNNSDILYFSSLNNGVLAWSISDNSFSIFKSSSPGVTFRSNRISSVKAGSFGGIWFSELGMPDRIHLLDESTNEWQTSPLTTTNEVLEIFPFPFGNIWIRLKEGLMKCNPEDGTSRQLTTQNGLINAVVYDVVEDKDGLLWYASKGGVGYITNPDQALSQEVSSIQPVYQDDPLFRDKEVFAIAVDGGNRKWIGTNEGLWLFGEEGDQLISHFTEANSPLPSDTILDITLTPKGEVFVATSKGLISFRGNASEGAASHSVVKIFPNPVKPGYNGPIGITGLVENAVVKITDISGNLVREIYAEGGTATWDGNTLSGSRVKTGVYLVFSSSRDGEENFIGKLAVVH